MVFGGAKISAPAMAAAHGMKDITLNQATNKLARPLMQHAPGPAPAAAPASSPQSAGQAADGLPSAPGGSPLAALTELAPGMLPSAPDLVPFPEAPQLDLVDLGGEAPAPSAMQPPPGAAAAMQAAGAAAPGAGGDPPADRKPPEQEGPEQAGDPPAADVPDVPEDIAEELSAASPKGPAPRPEG